MVAIFIMLAVVGYLVFLVDWKGLNGALSLGGWGAAVLFCVIAIMIYSILAGPEAANHAPAVMHH